METQDLVLCIMQTCLSKEERLVLKDVINFCQTFHLKGEKSCDTDYLNGNIEDHVMECYMVILFSLSNLCGNQCD